MALSAPRQFYVHVVGAVSTPGRYLVMPVSRVSDALMLAYTDTSRVPVGNPDFQPSLRNINVHRRDGARVSADLMAYMATGDRTLNPYLRDGDVISVPAFDPARQSVSVSGRVPFPGTYDLREGESLRDLVAVASGLPRGELQGSARVSRRASGSQVEESVSFNDGGGADFRLQARDHVYVLPEESDEGFAYVEGRVRFPGSYPIERGVTTVGDLVGLAGGLKNDAMPRAAYLVRAPMREESRMRRLAETRMVGLPQAVPPGTLPGYQDFAEALSAPSPEALRTMRLSDLDFLNRNYLAQELMLANRLPINLESGADATTLEDGDRLHVPRDEGSVFVFGQVVRPGSVPYREGATAADYVRDAGGLGPEANTVYLIEAGTLRFRDGTGTPLQSGDMVFVSRSEDTADSAELRRLALEDRRYMLEDKRLRAEARSRTLSAVLQGISAVATVAALIVTLRNN
jgi:protein involved in polysaccharide export with SLBB domain